MGQGNFYHRPVLLEEVIRGLDLKKNGVYFDGTAGGGGHSFAILDREPTATLIATDKDAEAIEAAGGRLKPFEGRFRLVKSDFKGYERVLDGLGVDKLDGFLLDLGISSHQIDDKDRGFSYLKGDAALDMRMDRDSSLTAREVVNGYSEETLYRILKEYGEERFSSAIVRNLVRARAQKPVETCGELKEIVEESIPVKFRTPACARQTFQAIRIEVNGELSGLSECVTGLARRLKKGGRGCVITFHSLEDRIVKQAFAALAQGCTCPKSFPVCVCGKKKEVEPVTKKPITASEEELKENSRSKSAKLRIIEKISE
ncbi:MAG: 16S rRNA (cytosine(1402)-N(4))-methyltransferase RsmH [Candidatus Gallimonas sp.]